MVNPSTESILNQMTNLAMDIALDYVLPASPMSDVCKGDLFEFERDVVAAISGESAGSLMDSLVASTLGAVNGCCGRPPTDLCKKNSYMGAAGCDSCDACLSTIAAAADPLSGYGNNYSGISSQTSSPSSSASSSPSSTTTSTSASTTAETTMDISWCQFDGCEFDTADNSYLDICDWIFYADRYALTDENREKVQKAFQMVPPGEVTGYVAQPPQPEPPKFTEMTPPVTIKTEIKTEPEDDYPWTSKNGLQPIILKAQSNADLVQITELDHSYLQTNLCSSSSSSSSVNSATVASPVKHHPNHLMDMLGLVTPPPSRSQSSEEEEIDVVNDSWDTPDPPRKGATMADIMKRGIGKKGDPPVTKWKNTVKRKHKTTVAAVSATYPMPPPPPKKLCGGLSLLDRYKKDTNWKDVVIKDEPIIKEEPMDDDEVVGSLAHSVQTIKPEPLEDEDYDEDYDMDADFESLMKNEPEDMFDDEYDDYNDDDNDNDLDWDKIMRNGGSGNSTSGASNGRGHRKSSGGCSSSCSSSSSSGAGRKKRKTKKKTSSKSSSKHHQSSGSSGSGKKIKYEGGGYNYKTKLMDPVKRALHNDLEKSRRVETSMLFMNLSMQVSFLDDNRKIPSKLSILRGAKRECDLMMIDERRLLSEKHVMQQKQRMLRERLFELRRDHYHRRYGKNTPKH